MKIKSKFFLSTFLSLLMVGSLSIGASAKTIEKSTSKNPTVIQLTESEYIQKISTDIESSNALAQGPITRYPAEGGTWKYGFWNAKASSYYTVGRTHGSTVKLGAKTSRSIDTVSGKSSIAEIWATQFSSGEDYYYYRVS